MYIVLFTLFRVRKSLHLTETKVQQKTL